MDDPKGLDAIPSLPRDEEGPVFREPWEAQAFSMTLMLFNQGHFTWKEWAECLGAEIAAAKEGGDPDLGDTYYLHWLSALDDVVLWCTDARSLGLPRANCASVGSSESLSTANPLPALCATRSPCW